MRILVVEDEPNTLEELTDCIHAYDAGLQVDACGNPLLALKTCESVSYDAALLDIQMPEMTGLDLADRLSAISPGISIVFVSAYNNYAAEAFEINAVDYILKPIRQERLHKALDKICKEESKKQKPASVPSNLKIQAFGKMIVSSETDILKWKRHKSPEIFAYLLHNHGTPVHKEKLCEMMWPEYDPQKALTYLQTIMYQLRKNIAEISENGILIEYADHCYRLRLDGVQYDVDIFLDAFEDAFRQAPTSLELLLKAEQCYTGSYFEEEGWIWAMGKQQLLAKKYQRVLESIIRIDMSRQNSEDALYYMKKWAALDVYQNQDYYLEWVKKNVGFEEARQLESIFYEDLE